MNKRILIAVAIFCVSFAIAALIGLRREHAQALPSVPNTTGTVVAQIAGRLIVDSTGSSQLLGYYPFIAAIPGPFFSGTAGEATAYFTFRSTPFQAQLVPNGNIFYLLSTSLTGSPYVESVYFNSSPHQDFQDPTTFSAGLLVARYVSGGFIGTLTPYAGAEAGSLALISSQDFTFQGETYNFANISRVAAINLTFPATPLSGGFTSPPAVVPFGGYAIAAAPEAARLR